MCPKNPDFPNKPYVVNETAGTKAICICGLSNKPPYCDGSHKGTGIKPMFIDIDRDRRVAYCGCRASREMPFCDGTHSIL